MDNRSVVKMHFQKTPGINVYLYIMENTQEIIEKLKSLKKDKKYIALSLHPAIGNTTIDKNNNRLFINEGRDGKWEEVAESFYDDLVNKFDSRYRK